MNIKLGIINIFMGLLNAIGYILFFFGFLALVSTGESVIAIIGTVLLLISEAGGIYTLKYEKARKLREMTDDFLKNVGSTFAWPILLFFLYILTQNKSALTFSLILTVITTIRTTSLIIKVYLIDKRIVEGTLE